MNRPQENSMARGVYMPDTSKLIEIVEIFCRLPHDRQHEVKGYALAHLGMAAQEREHNTLQNKPTGAMVKQHG